MSLVYSTINSVSSSLSDVPQVCNSDTLAPYHVRLQKTNSRILQSRHLSYQDIIRRNIAGFCFCGSVVYLMNTGWVGTTITDFEVRENFQVLYVKQPEVRALFYLLSAEM